MLYYIYIYCMYIYISHVFTHIHIHIHIYIYVYNHSYRGYITTYVFFPHLYPCSCLTSTAPPVAISNPGSMCQNGHDQLLLLRYTDKRADLCRAALRAAFCQVPGWCNEHWMDLKIAILLPFRLEL